MAGIGETSAIITVIALGYSLSGALLTFVGDFKEASNQINSLSNEIYVTCFCLQRLGDRAKLKSLPDRGALDANEFTQRCDRILHEIRSTIHKSDKPLDPKIATRTEIDISRFGRFKWAWSQKKLQVPRIELDRLKQDINLTLTTLMAVDAPTVTEKEYYAAEIPGIKRTLDWANRRYEQAVFLREHSSHGRSPPPHSRPSGQQFRLEELDIYSEPEADPEILEAFVAFKSAKLAEDRQKRCRQELDLQRLDDERKKEEERQHISEITAKAIADYKEEKKYEEAEAEKRLLQAKNELQAQLEHAHVSKEQIQEILDGMKPDQALMSLRTGFQTNDQSSVSATAVDPIADKPEISTLARLGNRFRKLVSLSPPGIAHDRQGPHPRRTLAAVHVYVFEGGGPYAKDRHVDQVLLSESEHRKYWTEVEALNNHRSIMETIVNLHPWFKDQFYEILSLKHRDRRHSWLIGSFENYAKPRRWGFTRRDNDKSVHLELVLKGYCRTEDTMSSSVLPSRPQKDEPDEVMVIPNGPRISEDSIPEIHAAKNASHQPLSSHHRHQSPRRNYQSPRRNRQSSRHRHRSPRGRNRHSSHHLGLEFESSSEEDLHYPVPLTQPSLLRSSDQRRDSIPATPLNALVPYERGVKSGTTANLAAPRLQTTTGRAPSRLVPRSSLNSYLRTRNTLSSPRHSPADRYFIDFDDGLGKYPRRSSYDRERLGLRYGRSPVEADIHSTLEDTADPTIRRLAAGSQSQVNNERGRERRQTDDEIIERQLALYAPANTSRPSGLPRGASSYPEDDPVSSTILSGEENVSGDNPSGTAWIVYDEPESM